MGVVFCFSVVVVVVVLRFRIVVNLCVVGTVVDVVGTVVDVVGTVVGVVGLVVVGSFFTPVYKKKTRSHCILS